MNFMSFIVENLGHTAPVLAAALFAVAVVLERTKSLVKTYPLKNTEDFMARLKDYVTRGELAQAVAMCDQNIDKPVAKIVKSGLQRAHLPLESAEQGMEITSAECREELAKRTPYLATIANVATLMGLFGTILGLIQSFDAVASAEAAQKSALLSAGISTSMNATMLGLGVAIPCMVAYAFLMNRTQRIQADIEEAHLKCSDLLRMRYFQPRQPERSKPVEGVA